MAFLMFRASVFYLFRKLFVFGAKSLIYTATTYQYRKRYIHFQEEFDDPCCDDPVMRPFAGGATRDMDSADPIIKTIGGTGLNLRSRRTLGRSGRPRGGKEGHRCQN